MAEIVGGGTPKTSVPEYWGGNIVWLSVADFNNGRKYVSQTQKTITELGLKNSSTKILNQGDIIISARGTVGVVAMLKTPMAFNQTSYGIKSKELVNNHFIYYMLKNASNSLVQNSYGSVFNTITSPILNNYKFLLPPLKVQQQIAEILSSFDDKIDLLHRQNKTLESLALTLFRHTFIDNPNRNEWEEKPLSEIAEIRIGRTPPRKEKQWFSTNPKNTKWISIKDMEGNIFIFNTAECLTNEAIEKFNIPIIPKGVVILSFKMTVGRVSITSEDMLSNEAIAHFKLHDKYKHFTEYLYLFLKSFEYETLGSTSSIVTAINTELIKNIRIINPDETTMKNFQIQTKGFFDKIYNNAKQIQNLQSMRDMLLSKILNDKMEV